MGSATNGRRVAATSPAMTAMSSEMWGSSASQGDSNAKTIEIARVASTATQTSNSRPRCIGGREPFSSSDASPTFRLPPSDAAVKRSIALRGRAEGVRP